MLREEEEVIHFYVPLIREGWLSLIGIPESELAHPCSERSDEWLVVAGDFFWCHPLPSHYSCASEIAPTGDEIIERCVCLLRPRGDVSGNPYPSREQVEHVYPACGQRLKEAKFDFKPLRIDERQSQSAMRKSRNHLISHVVAITDAKCDALAILDRYAPLQGIDVLALRSLKQSRSNGGRIASARSGEPSNSTPLFLSMPRPGPARKSKYTNSDH